MKKYSKTEQRERSKRLEYFEGLFLSVLAFENETGKNDEFSYWTETEKFGYHFNCEPNGGNSPKWSFNIID